MILLKNVTSFSSQGFVRTLCITKNDVARRAVRQKLESTNWKDSVSDRNKESQQKDEKYNVKYVAAEKYLASKFYTP